MFIGIIYNPARAEESIEGNLTISTNLDDIKNTIMSHVNQENSELDLDLPFEWTSEDEHFVYYPKNENGENYGEFVCAQVKNLTEGQMYHFSEHGNFETISH